MSRSADELRAIEDALIASIMNASPEETIAELREQGVDPEAGVALMDRMAAEARDAALARPRLYALGQQETTHEADHPHDRPVR